MTQMYIFPDNAPNDMLFTLLITDEVATHPDDKPCLDMATVNEFNSYNPIFGAIFIDEYNNDTLLALFEESIECFISIYSNNYSIIETNSSIEPSLSFYSFYGFIDNININNLNVNKNVCDEFVNVTWPIINIP
eukprot:98718_1